MNSHANGRVARYDVGSAEIKIPRCEDSTRPRAPGARIRLEVGAPLRPELEPGLSACRAPPGIGGEGGIRNRADDRSDVPDDDRSAEILDGPSAHGASSSQWVAGDCSNVVSGREAERNPRVAEVEGKLDEARQLWMARADRAAVRELLVAVLKILEEA